MSLYEKALKKIEDSKKGEEQEEKKDIEIEEPEVIKAPKPIIQKIERKILPAKKSLDANKIHREIRKLEVDDYTAYSVAIRRAKSGRSNFLKDYTALINKFIKEGLDIYEK